MTDQMRVFDRALVARRRARAAARVDQVAPILEDAADRLLDRLDDTTRRFTRALDLGGRGGARQGLGQRRAYDRSWGLGMHPVSQGRKTG